MTGFVSFPYNRHILQLNILVDGRRVSASAKIPRTFNKYKRRNRGRYLTDSGKLQFYSHIGIKVFLVVIVAASTILVAVGIISLCKTGSADKRILYTQAYGLYLNINVNAVGALAALASTNSSVKYFEPGLPTNTPEADGR